MAHTVDAAQPHTADDPVCARGPRDPEIPARTPVVAVQVGQVGLRVQDVREVVLAVPDLLLTHGQVEGRHLATQVGQGHDSTPNASAMRSK